MRSMKPTSCISRKPRAHAMKISPTATGATTTSGGRQPVCSPISQASVFLPSCLNALREAPQSKKSRSRSEEHTSELQSLAYLVCRLLLEKKKKYKKT